MTSGDADRRAVMPGATPAGSGRNPREEGVGASRVTAGPEHSKPEDAQLMEAAVERENMVAALRRVKANRVSAGVDGMTVEALTPYLKAQWPRIKEALLAGRNKPGPAHRVEIPKPDGRGMRQLGIPTVLDRLIQQALHQVTRTARCTWANCSWMSKFRHIRARISDTRWCHEDYVLRRSMGKSA